MVAVALAPPLRGALCIHQADKSRPGAPVRQGAHRLGIYILMGAAAADCQLLPLYMATLPNLQPPALEIAALPFYR